MLFDALCRDDELADLLDRFVDGFDAEESRRDVDGFAVEVLRGGDEFRAAEVSRRVVGRATDPERFSDGFAVVVTRGLECRGAKLVFCVFELRLIDDVDVEAGLPVRG